MAWRLKLAALATCSGLALSMGSAQAVPSLQLFIEHQNNGNTTSYEQVGENWVEKGLSSFRLWVISKYDQGGQKDPGLYDVHFVASYASSLGLAPPYSTDPHNLLSFVPVAPASLPSVLPGLHLGTNDTGINGMNSVLGAGTNYVEWSLGDMLSNASHIADYQATCAGAGPGWFGAGCANALPSPTNELGQINVYDVTVAGLPVGGQVQFDVYGYQHTTTTTTETVLDDQVTCPRGALPSNLVKVSGKCYHFHTVSHTETASNAISNPFSHDARWEQGEPPIVPTDIPTDTPRTPVPEPASLALMLAGLAGLVGLRRRKAA